MNHVDAARDLRKAVAESEPKFLAIAEEEASLSAGPDKWSRKQILGHLIDSAANNHQRFIRMQIAAELHFPGYQLNRGPVQNDFAGLAADHGFEAFFVVLVAEAVSDDGRDVDAGGDEDGHLVPGLVHFAAVDAADSEHVEDDLAPVGFHGLGGDAEDGDAAAVAHVVDHFSEAGGVAGHFESDVEAFLHAELFLKLGDGGLARIDGDGGSHFAGQVETEGVEVGDGDESRARVADDG